MRSTFELANSLVDKGHEVKIIYPIAPGEAWCSFREQVSRVLKILANLGIGRKVKWFDLKALLVKVPTLEEKYIPNADIVMATWWKDVHDISRYSRKKGEKFHFIRAYETWGGPEEEVNKTYTLPVHRIVVASYLKKTIEEKFGVHVEGPLKNGVNFNLFYSERKSYQPHMPKRIGILYRHQKLKGMADGLNAFLSAQKQDPNVQLVLFGESPSPEDNNIISSVDNKEIHISPYGAKLRAIYNSLDIFVFPSLSEGFSNPPMEAMACGAACVVTNAGAVEDYAINGETALVSETGDVATLERNIIELLKDEKKRQVIAENGCRSIQKFTWSDTANRLEQIFKQYAG